MDASAVLEDDFLLSPSVLSATRNGGGPATNMSPLGVDEERSKRPTPTRLIFRKQYEEAPSMVLPHLGANGLVSASDTLLTTGPNLSVMGATAAERELVSQLLWLLLGVPGSAINGAGASEALVGASFAAACAQVLPLALSYVRIVGCIQRWRSADSRILPSLGTEIFAPV
jgi:hypothetical protein